jgi:hypothetical protein
MPPIRTPKSTPEERRIANVIIALNNGEYTSLTKASNDFKVPYGKLRARFQGRPSTDALGGHNKLFDELRNRLYCNILIDAIPLAVNMVASILN